MQSALSSAIQDIDWIIPAVQTLHIVCVGIAFCGMLFVYLRILGLFAPAQPLAVLVRRFLPSAWYALGGLLASGSLLVIGEPSRSLTNPVFGMKMLMLLIAAAFALMIQYPLARDGAFWDRSSRHRIIAKTIAVASLILWTCIVFAGRWIAYSTDG